LAARRHWLVGEVARQLSGRCGVAPGARVVVGVSGGADSVALLLAAVAVGRRGRGRKPPLVEPVAAHVNHHLRDSADDDEALVADLCARHGVPLHTRHVHPDRLSGNVPANARALRYEELASVAASVGAGHVAAGHHAEDQLETLLIALGRGTGIDGLTGMAWSRPLAGDVSLVRPLLAVRKRVCEGFCRAAGVRWCEDPTNVDPSTVRARLRRDVLGVLDELWPDAAGRASGTADVIAAAAAALEHQVQEAFGNPTVCRWDRARLRKLPVPVIAAGLRRAAVAAAPEATDAIGQAQLLPVAEAIHDALRRPRVYDWPHGLRLTVRAREVRLESGGRASGGEAPEPNAP
jgi:tRNA(Ile)-lysidine synthetase-like protein